ncbi:MAG TPA: hypothetical protein VFX61_15135 [Micromonosporaceae bacterium]|nr:hypothetical protein [Micromonosporaceae bacterium]
MTWTGSTSATPPAAVRRIASEQEAHKLAHRLLLPGRRWPVVVLTIAGGHDEPFGDPEEIKAAVGDLAEVVLMPTSDVSWAFSSVMPDLTQVYGGAGRVYPVDHEWVSVPARSRLRFAYSPQDARRITDLLINDALEAALTAGLVEARTSPNVRQRSGTVRGVIGSRALVTLDDGTPATVWEELTVPGVPLERVVCKGQSVTGGYDPVSRRLDLRGALRYIDPADAEAAVASTYRAGDLVLADVAAVTDDMVRLRLLPGLAVEVARAAVTSNPNDTLRGLFSLGEVVVCRVDTVAPLRLRLDDIDDEEVPEPAPSLLPDGPPWLRLPDPDPAVPEPPAAPEVPRPAPAPPVAPVVPPRRPSPLDLARKGAAPTPRAATQHPIDAASLQRERARIVELSNELAAEQATRRALAEELTRLRGRAAQLEQELAAAQASVERLQSRYRGADLARQRAVKQLRAAQGRVEAPSDAPAFLDPEQEFRHEVYCEWVRRIPAAEKAEKPLADYVLAPGFLESIQEVAGVSRAKVVAVVVEVLTGQAPHLPGRDAHQLRTGAAGTPYVTRADGATCWRVALQRESAAARRLHYWRTSRDGFEFSRVVLHDDYRP